MKWGQAKHVTEYVQALCHLGDRMSNTGWVMNGKEMQLCWENIIFGPYDEVLVEDE